MVRPAAEPVQDAGQALRAALSEPEPPVRATDEKVLTILREEAEREARARREKTRLLDPQPDPLPDLTEKAQRRPAPSRKEPEPVAVSAAASVPKPEVAQKPEVARKVAARRDLLPDVEEIKSSLQPSEVPELEFVAGANYGRGGAGGSGAFRAGFLTVMTVAILGSSVYASAGWLSARVPALAEPMKAYVAVVDDLRLQLDGLMQLATVLITDLTG